MNEESQLRAAESLRDWSKWLIGVNFAAATGCVVVLQGGVKGPPRPFLMLAIAAFALSVLSSALLVRVLAALAEALPLRSEAGELRSIYGYSAGLGISVRGLARLQFGFLILGVVFFLLWVVLKPPPPEVPPVSPGEISMSSEARFPLQVLGADAAEVEVRAARRSLPARNWKRHGVSHHSLAAEHGLDPRRLARSSAMSCGFTSDR